MHQKVAYYKSIPRSCFHFFVWVKSIIIISSWAWSSLLAVIFQFLAIFKSILTFEGKLSSSFLFSGEILRHPYVGGFPVWMKILAGFLRASVTHRCSLPRTNGKKCHPLFRFLCNDSTVTFNPWEYHEILRASVTHRCSLPRTNGKKCHPLFRFLCHDSTVTFNPWEYREIQ